MKWFDQPPAKNFFCLLRHRNHRILTHMYSGRGAIMKKYKFLSFVYWKCNLRSRSACCSCIHTIHTTYDSISGELTHIWIMQRRLKYCTYVNLYWVHILCGFRCFRKMLSSAAAPYLNFKIAARHYVCFSLVNMTLSWLQKALPVHNQALPAERDCRTEDCFNPRS